MCCERSKPCFFFLALKYVLGVCVFVLAEFVPSRHSTGGGKKGIDSESTKWCLQGASCDIVIFTVSSSGYTTRMAVWLRGEAHLVPFIHPPTISFSVSLFFALSLPFFSISLTHTYTHSHFFFLSSSKVKSFTTLLR